MYDYTFLPYIKIDRGSDRESEKGKRGRVSAIARGDREKKVKKTRKEQREREREKEREIKK